MTIIIFDIDGTLADNSHRQHLIKEAGWDAFFDECDKDQPIKHIQHVIYALEGQGRSQIIFVTGRPERVREKTRVWLDDCYGFYPDRESLLMRADGDHRPDHVVKEEILDRLIQDGRKPDMVFDDRNEVVKMWRRRGIPCLQVAEGDF
jgi:phosphoglycolate phosphatase-like HAD superfamily hydrolase